jgi:hypothetical protein
MNDDERKRNREEISDRRDVVADKRDRDDDARHLVSAQFEQMVADSLRAQDKILAKVEVKLDSPVLNGGFDALLRTVDKMSSAQERIVAVQDTTVAKLDVIHDGIYDPEKGLYAKTKKNSEWINSANTFLKWFTALLVTGVLTGIGKLIYDFALHHLRLAP